MKLARYVGGGRVEIRDEPIPDCPAGGLLVKVEASGLCSGELMDWYMDRKIPHVLGHEVAGVVVESQAIEFPIGCRVAPHHHVPCMQCDMCAGGRFVHCPQWKRTKLDPGGMAEFVAVSAEHLGDCHRVDELRPIDAALIEPLGCVVKSVQRGRLEEKYSVAVVGMGAMGLLHLALLGDRAIGFEIDPRRVDWARRQGFSVSEQAEGRFDAVVVCPGATQAFEQGLSMLRPRGALVMFAPFAPEEAPNLDWNRVYFDDLEIVAAYSCGPWETSNAVDLLRKGAVRAEAIVDRFVSIDELPEAYSQMKNGEIVKAMVQFA